MLVPSDIDIDRASSSIEIQVLDVAMPVPATLLVMLISSHTKRENAMFTIEILIRKV
jgi:hypothetical protein